ncbi:hypothetical protein [Deinococcus sonorensis]|uniref:Uncharacterized protein n=2 Tax=Deinococcus sonorensis TaxID=309891 RepID=A0AAU7UDB1_9DEIO
MPAAAQQAQGQLLKMLSSSALPAELQDVLAAIGADPAVLIPAPITAQNLKQFSPAILGRALTPRPRQLQALSTTLPDQLLPTGTYSRDTQGQLTPVSQTPTDGMIITDAQRGSTLTAQWHVGGAPSVLITRFTGADLSGQPYLTRMELPTKAAMSVQKGSATIGALTFGMTPGACLEQTGPDALTLNLWAGNQTNPALKGSLNYAWDSTGLTLQGNATLQTGQGTASTSLNLAAPGTTQHRCDTGLSFTPTSLSFDASASVPGNSVVTSLKLSSLSNLTFSQSALQAQHPFAQIGGTLSASLTHNGHLSMRAAGSLADGSDLDLLPGDQVQVKYVKEGKLVTTTLQELMVALSGH